MLPATLWGLLQSTREIWIAINATNIAIDYEMHMLFLTVTTKFICYLSFFYCLQQGVAQRVKLRI